MLVIYKIIIIILYSICFFTSCILDLLTHNAQKEKDIKLFNKLESPQLAIFIISIMLTIIGFIYSLMPTEDLKDFTNTKWLIIAMWGFLFTLKMISYFISGRI